jgi:hypothetical protein
MTTTETCPAESSDPDRITGAFSYEQLRSHIQTQLQRIASENEIRHNLTQSELDRRFAAMLREMDQRFGATSDMRQMLQDEVDRRFEGSQRLLDERYSNQNSSSKDAFEAQKTAMQAAFDAAKSAVDAALAAAKEATNKAEIAGDKRFDSVNEFRGQLADQAATLMGRNEYNISHAALSEKVDTLAARSNDLELRFTSRLDRGAGKDEGQAVTRSDTRADQNLVAAQKQASDSSALRANIGVGIASLSALVTLITLILLIATHHL